MEFSSKWKLIRSNFRILNSKESLTGKKARKKKIILRSHDDSFFNLKFQVSVNMQMCLKPFSRATSLSHRNHICRTIVHTAFSLLFQCECPSKPTYILFRLLLLNSCSPRAVTHTPIITFLRIITRQKPTIWYFMEDCELEIFQ